MKVHSKVVASCYIFCKQGYKENSKVVMVLKDILKKLLALFLKSNNPTYTHFASKHAKIFQK